MGSTLPATTPDTMLATDHEAYIALIVYLALVLFFTLSLTIPLVIAQWRILSRGGCPGWAALIPFYNSYCLFKILFGNGWLFLLMLVPLLNYILAIILPFRLARVFGAGFGIGLGLLFLPIIFYLVLGFGDYCYSGPN